MQIQQKNKDMRVVACHFVAACHFDAGDQMTRGDKTTRQGSCHFVAENTVLATK